MRTGEALAAALLPAASSCPAPTDAAKVDASLSEPAFGALPTFEADLPLLEYPHEIVRYNLQCLRENLEYRLAQGEYRELADGVFAAPGAELGPYSVSNTRDGPIVLGANTQVGPFCCLSGPADLGEGTRVIEHAVIKDAVSIGHTAKIGGEVEASIIEPYTNKQHHGFLGHSYVGSWVNLGAGTCNSDLKNTYGLVKMEYDGEQDRHGHAVRRLHHRRLRQIGDQHQHLHRQDHRRLQHGLRLRHHQRAQLRQLRSSGSAR